MILTCPVKFQRVFQTHGLLFLKLGSGDHQFLIKLFADQFQVVSPGQGLSEHIVDLLDRRSLQTGIRFAKVPFDSQLIVKSLNDQLI